MIKQYINIIKEIKELQQELINISKTIKSLDNDINTLKNKNQELQAIRKKFDSKLKIYFKLQENKHKINSIQLIKDIDNDILTIMGEKNHIAAHIFETNKNISEKNGIKAELLVKKSDICTSLKRKYKYRNAYLEKLTEIYDCESQLNILKK